MPDQREIFVVEVRELAKEAICLHAYENMHVLLCFALIWADVWEFGRRR